MNAIYYREKGSELIHEEIVPAGKIMNWLYGTVVGKASLNLLLKRKLITQIVGKFMDSKFSKKHAYDFIEKYKLDMSEYEQKLYKNFNDFFYRKIVPEKREIEKGLVSPADGKILAFQSLSDVDKFCIKGCEFSVDSFLCNKELADKYRDGAMVIVRLAPTDYHRFHFPADGIISETESIKGHYYSVSPLALRRSLEIFCRNHRTISTLETKEYGDVMISEIGATMVGSIIQTYNVNDEVAKGQEKGYFAFGGSTLLMLFEKGKVCIEKEFLNNTEQGYETKIQMGQRIGDTC
ncbi:archaetidylserine decarboxylase [Aureibacter tunicatorum]|uniref:phosphatidylserine decarboxylase n=1 Tax=Aureibacter tunicatorum TaxID=866807 RepID=A0AAE3XTY6_9BACT|nr:archaetidylserine decarboxylase [Aureibacter tunicatorum]MDR6241831.1 phosphatidylserine decarboxylase [Aureibacter tunicatorum]BDD07078.1 phosphatidylserine decarboxylase proenzyme [Aureibacter tunicatorum]